MSGVKTYIVIKPFSVVKLNTSSFIDLVLGDKLFLNNDTTIFDIYRNNKLLGSFNYIWKRQSCIEAYNEDVIYVKSVSGFYKLK